MEMMVVMAIIALIVAIALPNTLAGLENLRLSAAARSVAAFLNVAANRAERREQGVELIVSIRDNLIAMRTADSPAPRTLSLPPGIVLRAVWPAPEDQSDAPREFVLQPGSFPPRIGIEIANPRGARRIVRLDPITGVARIEQPS
jgi:type II secretory pathway pseudopilin PulG